MNILAVIPARGGSKRLPGKNIRPFLGKPLLHWTIDFAKEIGLFDEIIVSTDSSEIARCAEDVGLPVPWLREYSLATDVATSVEVALDAVDRMRQLGKSFDTLALLQPTTPLRIKQRWQDAINMMKNENCPAIVGVGPAKSHPYLIHSLGEKKVMLPWTVGASTLMRTQDFPPAYTINGSLYLIKTNLLDSERSFVPVGTRGVVCNYEAENQDIDTELDWVVAETVIQHFGWKS